MKLRQKFFLSYFFLISIFSIVFVCCICFFFAEQSRRERYASAEKTCSQTAALLDYQFKQYLYSLYMLCNSEEVIHAIEQTDQPLPIGSQYLEALQMRNVLHRSTLPLPGVSARLYVDDIYLDVADHILLEVLPALEKAAWFQTFQNQRVQTLWLPTVQRDSYTDEETATLSLFRKVGQFSPWISELYIPQSDLQAILSAADPTEKGAVFLRMEDGTLLSSTNDALCNAYLSLCGTSSFTETDAGHWGTLLLEGETFHVYSLSLHSTDQVMTLLLPSVPFPFSISLLPKYAFWILAVLLLCSIAAARFFTTSFSRRLLHLDAKMSALCAGDLDVRIAERGNDEVNHLFRSFNHMAGEMKLLVQQQYENGIRVKTAELNALQAQINPHFLYNTLELINWKAMENDSPEIVRIAQDLADFYRLALGNGRSMVSLSDEIELVYRYLDIQNFRFSRDIRFLTEVPEDCLAARIPKLTLQPLVENAVLHGFLHQEAASERENLICLKAGWEGAALILVLTDNGCGMSPEQFAGILQENPRKKDSHGFGVPNIQERIQMLYGESCGLAFAAAQGGGVSVTIRLKPTT